MPQPRHARRRERIRRRPPLAALLAVLLGTVGAVLPAAMTAYAAEATFSNPTSIAIPGVSQANQTGPADPYPSTIVVSGMTGPVTDVEVTLDQFTHGIANDVDILLVAPGGGSLVLMSDVGGSSSITFADDATLVFADSGASFPAGGFISSGTYRPTNISDGPVDTFPAPAPLPGTALSFGGAFAGADPNGTWSLYIVDDASGDAGSISGGWSLTITTEETAQATVTVVMSSVNPSEVGDEVTFTATVTSGGAEVTTGTVTFSEGGTPLGSPVAVNGSGVAEYVTSALPEGSHTILATYNPGSGFLTSTASLTQVVDNPTTVSGTSYCNTGPIEIPDPGPGDPFPGTTGPASVYPSRVTVGGLGGTIADVELRLLGLSHSVPVDLDILLAGPDPADNLIVLSDAGGINPVSGIDVTFDDDAVSAVGSAMTSTSYRPTNLTGADAFPAPAPVPSAETTLAGAFGGTVPDGVWSLYIVDDATGDAGSLSGGWCLDFTLAQEATTTTLTGTSTAEFGQEVTLTASVASGGSPVTTGSVTFSGLPGGDQVVPVNGDGDAVLSTSALPVGTYDVTASFAATGAYAASTSTQHELVITPLAGTGGPYTIAEGEGVTLEATGSTPSATFAWDLDDDGAFDDAAGFQVQLSWQELVALGIGDGPASYPVAVQVTAGGLTATAATAIDVVNTAPVVVVDGPRTATVGVPLELKVSADDPSPADMAGLFLFTVDWGDGSPLEQVTGPADPPVSHTYATAGQVTATFTIEDPDGGIGTLEVAFDVAAAPSDEPTDDSTGDPTESPAEDPAGEGTGALPVTGADSAPLVAALGLLMLVAGAVAVRARSRMDR